MAASRGTARAYPVPLSPVPGTKTRERVPLKAVSAPVLSASRIPFLIFCAAILVSALLAALLLNVMMTRGSYEHNALRSDAAKAEQDIRQLQVDLQEAQSQLPQQAATLGMVPSTAPILLQLATGTVVTPVEVKQP